jgi:hypothetical protein
MYLTIHPLSRVFPPRVTDAAGWPASTLAALPQPPVAHWIGTQIGSSTGYLVAVWTDADAADTAAEVETTTPERVVVSTGRRYRLHALHTGQDAKTLPGVVQLTMFHGPRSEAQVRADELSDRRISAALQGLPGVCGSLRCYSDENDHVILSFADTQQTITAALERITSTELTPEEDSVLLKGPDDLRICWVTTCSGTIASLSTGDLVGGGVR